MHGLNAEQLLEQAQRTTGARDLGHPRFFAGFQRLVRAIDTESPLTEDGRRAAEIRLLRLLKNQLRFQADIAAHPEILEQKLAPPVFVSGLPRVGSTKLHRLLAEGGDFQSMMFWQSYNHARIPGAAPGEPDPRIAEAIDYLTWRSARNPATVAAHFMAAQEPEEETYLLEYGFSNYWPDTYFGIPSYLAALPEFADHDATYLYLRQSLQYLQWQFYRDNPKPWVLKSPLNLGHESHIAKHFPGAVFLILHRDPATVIPSTAALAAQIRKLYCATERSVPELARWTLGEYSSSMERVLAWRDSGPDNPLLDIAYRDVQDDDMAVVTRVYELLGRPLSAEAAARMEVWRVENARHKHGVHEYSLESSGLTAEEINTAFATYIERFGKYLY
jgi:hypothetical protein